MNLRIMNTIQAKLDEIKKRCLAATPVLWILTRSETGASFNIHTDDGKRIASAIGPQPDAAFIAHARTDLPTLAQVVEVAVKALEQHLSHSSRELSPAGLALEQINDLLKTI